MHSYSFQLDDGISIPCSYTSYVAPLQSLQIYNETRRSKDVSNAREVCCSFNIQQDAVVHGIAGYFEAILYKDVTLSTHPDRHSPQMVSWFPLVFPFEYPIHVRSKDRITLYLWRNVSSRYVWYEWVLTEPRPTKIHNAAGHVYKIAL
ncbi:unnamed protein product [Schistosoma margrebowiei]|uniref:PRMT5 oligomerisation domain-containing protein n=1 Tax=Schistosoma margrebowiei TaxID=48269 RepID=A0A183LS97_9TREM|nr:unnamed protein product [Schistosoma margrebowiei]